jgi:hypothetical protein
VAWAVAVSRETVGVSRQAVAGLPPDARGRPPDARGGCGRSGRARLGKALSPGPAIGPPTPRGHRERAQRLAHRQSVRPAGPAPDR